MEASLLEILQARMEAAYLSDLRFLDDGGRMRLRQQVMALPPEAASLQEWNDTLDYLTNAPLENTAEAARKQLIALLSPLKQTEFGG